MLQEQAATLPVGQQEMPTWQDALVSDPLFVYLNALYILCLEVDQVRGCLEDVRSGLCNRRQDLHPFDSITH